MTQVRPDVGSAAPDFELRNQHGQTVRLTELRGRPVLLVFYPYAFTGVCTGELGVLRDEFSGDDAPAEVLAVSCDTTFALRVFAEQEGLEFAMLSDFWPHGSVTRAYGVFDDERGCPLRGTFVIDADGVVVWSVVNAIPDARDAQEYRRVLGELSSQVAAGG
jgi:peroxiredoxin